MSYIDKLIDNCNKAKSTKYTKKFVLNVNDLSALDNIKKAIYIIEEIGGDIGLTFKSLKTYKDKKEARCPKLNSPSKYMYVGSSTTGIKTRIKQHVGEGYKGTYALHLNKWFEGDYKIKIREYDKDISREVLQIIEDDLSDKLKPAFGKQGGNNK